VVRGASTHARPIVRLGRVRRVRRVASDRVIHVRSPTYLLQRSFRFISFRFISWPPWVFSSSVVLAYLGPLVGPEEERERDGERSLRVCVMREAATSRSSSRTAWPRDGGTLISSSHVLLFASKEVLSTPAKHRRYRRRCFSFSRMPNREINPDPPIHSSFFPFLSFFI